MKSLITKLNGIVDNDELTTLNAIKVKFLGGTLEKQSLFIGSSQQLNLVSKVGIKASVDNNEFASASSILNQYFRPDSIPASIDVVGKAFITSIKNESQDGTLKIKEATYLPMLQEISNNGNGNLIVDLNNLVAPNLEKISYANIVLDTKNFSVRFPKVHTFNVLSENVYGKLSDFSAPLESITLNSKKMVGNIEDLPTSVSNVTLFGGNNYGNVKKLLDKMSLAGVKNKTVVFTQYNGYYLNYEEETFFKLTATFDNNSSYSINKSDS